LKVLFLGPQDKDLDSFFRKESIDVSYFTKKIEVAEVEKVNPDLIVSYGYKYIIRPSIFRKFRTINLHISYLPYNRGSNPNFWSFYHDTIKGVTIHEVAKAIDSGNIIKQKEVFFTKEEDDLEKTYNKLKKEMSKLFVENWQSIRYNTYIAKRQDLSQGSYYTKKDFLPLSGKLKSGWKTKTSEIIKWKKEQI
jgi:methionyl-tRNA formyltransferase